MSDTRWQTTQQAGIVCGVCEKKGTCTVSPDLLAFKCWRDSGKVHHIERQANGKGNAHEWHFPKL